jgi:hypothetical protein
MLRGWFERTAAPADPAYRAWQEALVQEGCRTFAAVHQSTTAAQREQAVRRLRAYQRDLRELSGAAPVTGGGLALGCLAPRRGHHADRHGLRDGGPGAGGAAAAGRPRHGLHRRLLHAALPDGRAC